VIFVDPIGDDLTVKEVGSFRDKREAKDYACMQVVDCSSGVQVAEWHARLDSDLLGVEAARLGYLYGKAKIAPEMTGGYGQKTLDALLRECGYGNVYITEEANTVDRKQTRRWGWFTSNISRREMLDALKVVVRERPDCIRSKELVDEMRSFVVNDRGKAAAAAGTYDDRVMAMAGAYALYLRNVQSVQRVGKPPKRAKPTRSAILENAPRV
jgi:phage terminase large subunit